MAVWIYAYGKNNLPFTNENRNVQILNILNGIELNELKILDTIEPVRFTKQYYTENRESLEQYFKSMEKDKYKDYLSSINLSYIEVEKIIDHFISDGERQEHEAEAKYSIIYNQLKAGNLKSNWQVCENNFFLNNLCYFDNNFDGLRLSLINDLIRITGPFSVFSKYLYFLQDLSEEHRAYYHNYFKEVLKALKSDFIIYAHEWSELDDEDNKGFDFEELKASSNWDVNSSKTLDTMDRFYFEQLS